MGGAGFIGSHLLRALAAGGRFRTLISADIAEPRFRVDGVTYKTVDVRAPLPADLCPQAPTIFNLAAVHTTPGHEDTEYFWTNVLGAIHVCDYARRVGTRALIFTSSISVYGTGDELKDEDAIPQPESAYGRSKLAAEKIHRQWFDEQPERRKLIIARPAAIYGFGEGGNFSRLAHLLSRKRFAYPGRKDTIKSCGYVEDLTGTFTFMLDRPEQLILYNFAHAERLTAADICGAFGRVAEYGTRSPVIPIRVMLTIASLFELFSRFGLRTSINRARVLKLFRSTNIYPGRLVEMAYPYKFTLDAALERWRTMGAGKFD